MSTYNDSEGLDLMCGNQLVHPLSDRGIRCLPTESCSRLSTAGECPDKTVHEQYDLNLHMLKDIFSLSAAKKKVNLFR